MKGKCTDNELQLMAGDRPQVNPIKAGNKPKDKSLYQFFIIHINNQIAFK
jgi:hypothetical protein